MTMIGLAISPCAVRAGTLTPTISATTPALAAMADGDTLSDAVTWGEVTPIDGVTITETRQMQLSAGGAWVAYDGDHEAAYGEVIAVRQVWEAEGYTTLIRTSASVTVAGIAPDVTASDALIGRTITITVSSLTGVPAPSAIIAMTLDGTPVAPSGSGPWSYVVPDSAASQTVAWAVTATNATGSDTASGAEVVAANLFAPANTMAPAITGSAEVGGTLTCSTGTWTGTPTPTYTRQWRRAGSPISGETASTYTPVEADEGATITCTVIATNTVGSASSTSAGVTISAAGAGPEITDVVVDAGEVVLTVSEPVALSWLIDDMPTAYASEAAFLAAAAGAYASGGPVDLVFATETVEIDAGGVPAGERYLHLMAEDSDGDFGFAVVLYEQIAAQVQDGSDDFERADGALGADWDAMVGTPTIVSGAATVASTMMEVFARNVAVSPAANQYSEITIAGLPGSGGQGPAVRMQAGTMGCYYLYWAGGSWEILRRDSGSETVLASGSSAALAVGHVLRLEVSGTVLRAMRNGATIATYDTASDAVTYSSGNGGFEAWRGGGASQRIGLWSGGSL